MMRILLWVGLGMSAVLGETSMGDKLPDQSQPVLVELFTSEGCSSCPPADALLERLDRTQPVAGAQIIVLSEHVDYWNHIGWADPYSSAAFSARQLQYARRFRTQGPYTPQMVVDGRTEFVGSDARSAESAVREALRQPRAAVRITGNGGAADIEIDPLPAGKVHKAGVFVAYAADTGTQDVLRGENKGRHLRHVSIAKDLKQVGTVDDRVPFKTRIPLESGSRVIVFVQEAGNGAVWGAALMHSASGAGR
jgi:hypothetical protein